MLSLSPHHRQNCKTRSITERFDLQLAEQKLFVLAQIDSFRIEVNALRKKKNSFFRKSS